MYNQDIIDIFRIVDTTITGTDRFYQGNRKKLSNAYGKPFPQTHLYPIVSEIDKEGNAVHNIKMVCWEQDSLQNTAVQTEAVIHASQLRVVAFTEYLRDNYPTLSIGSVFMSPEEKTLQATASGYSAIFKITSKMICQ
jgi:hypothetical protein